MQPANARSYLALVIKSGLIPHEQMMSLIAEFERLHGPSEQADPRAIGDFLLDRDLITTWQDRKLSEGRFKGFVIAKRYRLLDHLATDTQASQYLAVHTPTGRRVKITVAPPQDGRKTWWSVDPYSK